MKKKNPERGVTQINDQKKPRMKEIKSTPSFLLNTHRSDLLAGYRDRMSSPTHPHTLFSGFNKVICFNQVPSAVKLQTFKKSMTNS